MKSPLEKVLAFPLVFGVLSLLIYGFYGVVIGISLVPSAIIFWYSAAWLLGTFSVPHLILFCLITGFSIFVFFLFGLIVFGITERLLTWGIKPGRYQVGSVTFIRWMINGGVHTIALNFILPYMAGTNWIKMHFRLVGCKIGKDVFINSKGLHDSFLLRLGDNVIIGGDVNITCHLFEGRTLILDNIVIGDNTLIGAGSYVMPGARVGQNCSIGAYSIIMKRKRIDDNSVIMPVPGLPMKQVAKIVKESARKSEME